MKTDIHLQKQIEKALESNLVLKGSQIEVIVDDGDVLLTGTTDKFHKKNAAKKTAKEVEGVKHIAEQLEIITTNNELCTDAEIEAQVNQKFKKNFGSAHQEIKTIVKDGHVWLEGRLKWNYQKELAEECIQYIPGIKGIENNIYILASLEKAIDEKDIFAAIYGDPSINSDIKVEIVGQRIILKGCVENTDQKNLVTRLVRNVAGVNEVENFLTINWMRR